MRGERKAVRLMSLNISAYKPPNFFFASTNLCIILSEMAETILILVKPKIFYEFSKWREIKIRKPITDSKNLHCPKGMGRVQFVT